MLVPHPATRSLDAAAFAGLLWAIAVAVPGTRALMPARMVRLDPLAIDYATTAAAAGGLLVLVGACWRLRVLRRLELGVGDRVRGALALAITAPAVVLPAAVLDVGPPDRLLPAGVVAASLLCLWAATTPEATTVSSALRGALAVVTLGAPTVLLAGLFARQMPEHAGVIVLSATALAVVVGLIARAVARPLGPEQSRWLEAIDLASRGALQPEPDAALRAALAALGKAFDTTSARPELWRAFPPETLSVDIAGYLHVHKAEAPKRLYDLALAEPERTLRAEVLEAVQVRRPEVRSLFEWFATRRAFSATLVLDEEGCQGFLLLPHGGRNTPMTLEEARSIRILADRISSLLAVSSALARSRERELEAERRFQALEQERERLEGIIACTAARHQTHAERHARSAQRTAYSPAARLALGELERRAKNNRGIVLLAPLGCDASAWMAIAHLLSVRSGGPWVLIDAAQGAEQRLERWQDPLRSPLKQADGGTLAVLDLPALPLEAQRLIADALAQGEDSTRPTSVSPLGLIAVVREPVEGLVQKGKLERRLARALDSAAIPLPAVAERAEDLRAMVLDHLSELGIRLRGDPLGIDAEGLRLIMEHTWPGNELELASTLLLAARLAPGQLVSAEDLGRAGLELPRAPASGEPAALPVTLRNSPRLSRRR
jgi:hypothetical protein